MGAVAVLSAVGRVMLRAGNAGQHLPLVLFCLFLLLLLLVLLQDQSLYIIKDDFNSYVNRLCLLLCLSVWNGMESSSKMGMRIK